MQLIEQREGAEHAVVWQLTAAEDDTVAAYKAVGPNGDRLAVLAVVLEVDGMAEQLGMVASDGGEGADGDAVGAVNVMVLGDGGVFAKQQCGAAAGLMGEVGRISARCKTRDPVAAAD